MVIQNEHNKKGLVLFQVLQREPACSRPEACSVLESVSAAAAGKPLCCPNHEGKVRNLFFLSAIPELKHH